MSELADLEQVTSLEPEPGDVATITVVLTVAQAIAITNLADLGIDERAYDIGENHPYTDEEEAEALAESATAEVAMSIITAAVLAEQEK